MELICPSCEARYQLPDGSISGKGRQVSCMNCGHSWHAYPPMMLGDQAVGGDVPRPSDSKGIRYEPKAGAPRPGERRVDEPRYAELGSPGGDVPAKADAPADDPDREEPVEASGTGGSIDADMSRTEQLAEIRQMLAEVQAEERGSGVVAAPAAKTLVSAAQPKRSAAEEDAERARRKLEEQRAEAEREAREAERAVDVDVDEDNLRSRIDKKADKGEPKRTDVKKMRKKHERRVNREKHASKAGSGAFMTGFLLIAIIAATMVALYTLSPEIIARMPEAERPMTEYVATMDRLRTGASQSIANLQELIAEKLGDKEG